MGSGVPLLNEYKRNFFFKRLPQTVLGGAKLRLGYDAPFYIYLNQVLVFLLPCILGGLFTILVEVGVLQSHMAVYTYGAVMAAYVISLQLASTIFHQKKSSQVQNNPKASLLSEEDEIDFYSCCGIETVGFVIPPKKYKINILLHGLISGPMCGLGLWYLLPQTLNGLFYNNIGATVVLYILGWVTLCIAQYPLTTGAPPEPATYRALDTYELSPLMRPFYVFVCLSFFLLGRYLPEVVLADQILHAVFVCLPILWVLGTLPPLDALLFWVLEQFLVFFLGGSPMASDGWLLVMVVLSVCVYVAVYLIPVCLGSVVLAAALGYILSTDLGGMVTNIIKYHHTRNKVESSQSLKNNPSKHRTFPWKGFFIALLYHFTMTIVTVAISFCLQYFNTSVGYKTFLILGYVVIGLLVLEKCVRDLQGVFIFFGLWRNRLFPGTVDSQRIFLRRKKFLKVLGIVRRGLVNWVAPLVMLSYLSVVTIVTDAQSTSCRKNLDTAAGVWLTFALVRAFRWVWQSTVHSLLEVSVVHLVLVTLSKNSMVQSLGVYILLLLIGLCRDRFFQIINKLYFFSALFVTAWTDKKQRRKSTGAILLSNVILFPVVLGVIIVAAALSAPLLPIFTLPIFLIGFPRPLRSWPSAVGSSANTCSDSVYYKQLSYHLAQTLKTAFANGSLGEAHVGNHYLVRYQDRLAWVLVLERGATFCTLSIKGLELQETSCHSVEATRLDDIFETSFETAEQNWLCSFNQYPLHTLTPCDVALVKTYSDARNILTGIIDSPDNFKLVFSCFPKALVWVLLQHMTVVNREKERQKNEATNDQEKKNVSDFRMTNNNNESCAHKDTVVIIGVTGPTQLEQNGRTVVQELDTDDVWEDTRPPSSLSLKKPKRKSSWSSSIRSFSSILSDDKEGIEMNHVKKKQRSPSPSLEDSFGDLGFGLPAVDPKVKAKNQGATNLFAVPRKRSVAHSGNAIYRPITNLAGSSEFTCPYSSQLGIPSKWRELPIEESRIKRLTGDFPVEWFKHVLRTLVLEAPGKTGTDVSQELAKDDVLCDIYSQLTMACYGVFDVTGSPSYGGGSSHLYKCYRGDVPWNAMLDWLTENKDLFDLVLKAYRYAFKLMLDQCLLGEAETLDELVEYLQEYDRDWYIGLETDPDWTTAVLHNTPSLFSIGHTSNQGTYSSRVLSLQEMPVRIGRVNAEAVRGQWANLGLELLYFTNDDEERYSIQAHPTLLRNLTVQSADPPLGYPIFSSQPMSVSLL